MKTFLILLVSFVACLGNAQGWITLKPAEAGFSVQVPSKPQTSSRNDQDQGVSVKTQLFVSVTSSANYVVSVSYLPRNAPSSFSKNMMDGIKKGLLSSTGGTATSDGPQSYNGYNGRLVRFKTGNGANGAVWMFSSGGKVYTLTLGKKSGSNDAEIKKFFGSFRIVG
jgi:hypothetical protein